MTYSQKTDQNKKNQFRIIFFVAFLNLIGFGMIIPLLPHYAKTFDASIVQIGLLVASYAAAQFIGSPVWGRFSDRFGRRPTLMLTIFGGTIGYILFGLAGSLTWLFLSRILAGFMSGNISAAQAYIADITDIRDRAKGLGMIGAAFGLGFILGPGMGGLLSNWGYNVPAFAAAGLDLINLVAIYFWLPESLPHHKRKARGAGAPGFSLTALREALIRPLVGSLLYSRFFFSLAFSTFTTVFAIYAEHSLHLSAQETAYVLAYVGVLIVLVQGVIIGRLTRRFAEGNLLFVSITLMVFSLLGWAFVRNVPMLLVIMVPLAFASGVFNTVINSALSKAVTEEEIGGTLGLSASLDSFTRIIAPSFGGFLLAQLGAMAPGLVSSVLLGLLVPYAWKKFIAQPHPILNSNLD